MEINVNVSIKRYLEVELNKLEEEKTKLDGRLEDITRQINLYEQLIATYDHVEEEVKKIIEEPVVEEKKEKPTTWASRGTKYAAQIFRIIDGYGEAMTCTEIALVMNVPQGNIHGALKLMVREGLLSKSGFKYDIKKKEVKSNV